MWSNYHTHTNYCDGKSSLSECIQRALEQHVVSLGFSSHAPLPFNCKWCMKREQLEHYLAELEQFKKENKNIDIYKGLEIDYIPGVIGPKDFAEQLDYTIGSIHFVNSFNDGTGWEIDSTLEVFNNGLQSIFNNDIKEAVVRYYELTREMIADSKPDLVGHLDKIKMHNKADVFFREDDAWYREEIDKTLDVISASGCILEVNTRGIYQRKTEATYPGPWIIERAFQKKIPVTLSSDAHHPDDLTNTFPETAALLLEIGYKTISVLSQGEWKQLNFSAHGIDL